MYSKIHYDPKVVEALKNRDENSVWELKSVPGTF